MIQEEEYYCSDGESQHLEQVEEDEDQDSHMDSSHMDDEEEEEDYDSGSDQGEDPKDTLVSELKETWHQHVIAIVIAIVATFVAHRHIDQTVMMNRASHFFHNNNIHNNNHSQPHEFLRQFQRTANVSFCSNTKRHFVKQIQEGSVKGELQLLEFDISKDLVPSFYQHLAADAWRDDRYQQVFAFFEQEQQQPEEESHEAIEAALMEHEEYQCLEQQIRTSPFRVKGHSYVYSSPTVQSMYPPESVASVQSMNRPKTSELKPVYLTFTGFAIKIVNLSTKPVLLYWRGKTERLVGEIGPFESIGTSAQSSGQTFVVTPVEDSNEILHQWIVTIDNPILYYDPQKSRERTLEQEQRYQMHILNQQFDREYSLATKRSWLAHFPRPLPVHPFWPAKQFGQTHQISSSDGRKYQMEVASVTPRVFTIPNFLSKEECDQLIQLAQKEGLAPSTLTTGNTRARQQQDRSTRSSSNTWMPRYSTELADTIYRRASHVLQIDESLLQNKNQALHAHEHSLAESLQVVRYKQAEEYTAHHDFVYPPTFHRHQPTRFATLLLYLNDDFEGGETVFPRAVSTQFHDGIAITPKKGTAVLFYNMLPDGNMDDLSQHASRPVTSGEKWLANLWVWEPHIY